MTAGRPGGYDAPRRPTHYPEATVAPKSNAAYDALDYLLSKDTSDQAAGLRSQLAVDLFGDDLPEDGRAHVEGFVPDTPQARLARAQAAADQANAALREAQTGNAEAAQPGYDPEALTDEGATSHQPH